MELAIALTIVGVILGGGISWYVTREYYLKSATENQKLIDKIPSLLVDAIRQAEQEKLTLDDLDRIIADMGIDVTPGGLMPTKCPECGGKVRIRGSHHDGEIYVVGRCENCGWRREA